MKRVAEWGLEWTPCILNLSSKPNRLWNWLTSSQSGRFGYLLSAGFKTARFRSHGGAEDGIWKCGV